MLSDGERYISSMHDYTFNFILFEKYFVYLSLSVTACYKKKTIVTSIFTTTR